MAYFSNGLEFSLTFSKYDLQIFTGDYFFPIISKKDITNVIHKDKYTFIYINDLFIAIDKDRELTLKIMKWLADEDDRPFFSKGNLGSCNRKLLQKFVSSRATNPSLVKPFDFGNV